MFSIDDAYRVFGAGAEHLTRDAWTVTPTDRDEEGRAHATTVVVARRGLGCPRGLRAGHSVSFWLWGDQLGPHFDPGADSLVLIEAKSMFRRRRYHRQKAHLILTAMRMRAQEDPRITYIQTETFREGLGQVAGPSGCWHPHSRPALELARSLGISTRPETPGFLTTWDEFDTWAEGRGKRRLLLEDWYRSVRRSQGILMRGEDPKGGQWNFDEFNRESPPRGRPRLLDTPPWRPVEGDVDKEVRALLDTWRAEGIEFAGEDGPRLFAASHAEARAALQDFLDHRLAEFGPFEDAMMQADPFMAHSMLSAPLNLGLLSPRDMVDGAIDALARGAAPLASVEGFVRQLVGWREYVWHLYWRLGPDYPSENHLSAHHELPAWWENLDADQVEAACLSDVLHGVSERGWVHHIPRLMVLANWALQRGYRPDHVNEWFQRMFVDGYPWVMAANTIGMGLYADGGIVATKPYAAGGAYVKKMSNYCGDCRYSPTVRVGEDACPFTAGYWWFLDRNQEILAGNHRMARALAGLRARPDIDAIGVQEERRGDAPP